MPSSPGPGNTTTSGGALFEDWPDLAGMEVRRLTERDCQRWAARYAQGASPTNFNNSLGVLRNILQLGIAQGIRYQNPAAGLKRARVRPKQLTLPSQAKVPALVAEIRKVPFGPGLASAELVEFLAYGGFRKGEATSHRYSAMGHGQDCSASAPLSLTENPNLQLCERTHYFNVLGQHH